jgi:factor associated with neutral sphingomyelinase activation
MHKNSFFWEKGSSRKRTKTRFNLLLLEYGEFFVDDLGVFQYPDPEGGSRDFFQCDALKVQGRLKMCTRSFIFEPTDGRKPLLKFPFKYMSPNVVEYPLSASQRSQCTIEASGFFSFTCSTIFEMKDDGKIAPYRQVDCADAKEPTDYFFAVSHSHIGQLLGRISRLRQIHLADERGELDTVSRLLAELTSTAPTAVFDASKLIDFHEKLRMDVAMCARKIKPLVMNPGYLMMTDLRLYFQPGELNNVGEATQHYDMSSIFRLYKRRYLLMDTALELIMIDGESVLFCFDSVSSRDYIHDSLNAEPHLHNSRVTLSDMTLKWQQREVSNFDYLMFVNNEAGRSLSDLAQYPVYPHVITDYSSKSLDLTNPATFRDLSKPVGALNPTRLEFFKERMQSMPPEDSELGIPPQFLYGTHYSTPGYVLYYLVRVAPEHMLCLQSGKFDSTDRMFISLADTWESCYNNPADLKELIPEFFCGKSGEFLVNISDLDLGRRQTGEKLHDVELPPWAKSPKDFIKKHTKALESDYVSEHLHEWIDLIFGVCQRGELAIEQDNLFFHLTYEGSVDMETITDPRYVCMCLCICAVKYKYRFASFPNLFY